MPSSLHDVQNFIAGTSVWGLLILATALEMNGGGSLLASVYFLKYFEITFLKENGRIRFEHDLTVRSSS